MNFAPKDLNTYFNRWFNYEKTVVHCQLDSHSHAKPHIRTMRLWTIDSNGHLQFLTRADTQKWADWSVNPQVAVCFYHENFGQILLEGNVILKTKQTHPETTLHFWNSLPTPIKKLYSAIVTQDVPLCFGMVMVMPTLWEVLELCRQNYLESNRTLYRLQDEVWVQEKIPVHS